MQDHAYHQELQASLLRFSLKIPERRKKGSSIDQFYSLTLIIHFYMFSLIGKRDERGHRIRQI